MGVHWTGIAKGGRCIAIGHSTAIGMRCEWGREGVHRDVGINGVFI